MPEERRRSARKAANEYAAQPGDSFFMYAVVGVVLLMVALVVLGQFYAFNLIDYPISILASLLIVVAVSIVIRRLRTRRHNSAYDAELKRREP